MAHVHLLLGLMSSLVREAFANTSPSAKFTLDATTAASRDRYLRLGYEVSLWMKYMLLLDFLFH